jgi:very-short-patch-repair endonuclease
MPQYNIRWIDSTPLLPTPSNLPRENVPADQYLWQGIQSSGLNHLQIHRHYTLGPYVTDFYHPASRLVMEVDGDVQSELDAVGYNLDRGRWLTERGYRVLCFTDSDIYDHLDDVLAVIAEACAPVC